MFAYCGNDPINRVDPTGKSFWDNLKFFGKKALEVGTAVLGIAGAVTTITTAFTGTIMSGGAGAVSIPAAAALATECLAMAGAAVSALGITSLAVAECGEVISEKTNRIKNPSKNDSDVWNKLERVKGSDMKN